jgi:adenylate cyclase
MRSYEKQQWREAAGEFGELARLRPDDLPSKIMHERCRGFLAGPPPADWDGVFVLHEK